MKLLLFDLDGTLIDRRNTVFGQNIEHHRNGIRMAHRIQPEPEVVELIANLSTTYRIVVVSNGSPGKQRLKLRQSGLLPRVHAIVTSADAGVAKPAAALFHRACRAANGTTQDVAMMIGDDPTTDVNGAQRLGIPTCWISRGRDYPKACVQPDHIIDTLLDLPEVLPCLTRES